MMLRVSSSTSRLFTGERTEVQAGLAVHAHLAHGVVQQLRHAGDVVVRAIGRAFLAKEQFFIGHAAQQHAHVVFDVALGLEQVDPLLVEDEAQCVGARIGLKRNLDGFHIGQNLLPVVVGQLAFVLEVHQEMAPLRARR